MLRGDVEQRVEQIIESTLASRPAYTFNLSCDAEDSSPSADWDGPPTALLNSCRPHSAAPHARNAIEAARPRPPRTLKKPSTVFSLRPGVQNVSIGGSISPLGAGNLAGK
jgi:hypothetical protein